VLGAPVLAAATVLMTAVAGTATAVLATVAAGCGAAEMTAATVSAAGVVVGTVGDVVETVLDGTLALDGDGLPTLLPLTEAVSDGPLDEDVWLTPDRFLDGEPLPTPVDDAA
jgi:hypothetical protein